MLAVVDQEKCIGCGLCPSISPEVFEIGDNGKAHSIADPVPGDCHDSAQEAADSCPVNAIEVH